MLHSFLLLTCGGASVPRYDSSFPLGMSDVRAKHFRQDAANSKNLTLCNQKYRLFFYLLGKSFAPTSVGRITREPDAVSVPSFRVERFVTAPLPHRPGRADFPHPVPANSDSLKDNYGIFHPFVKKLPQSTMRFLALCYL